MCINRVCLKLAFLIINAGIISTNELNTNQNVNCLPGWYAFGNHCYRAWGSKEGERLGWNEASKKCAEYDKDGALISIHSEEENEFAKFLFLPLASDTWIGIHDQNNSEIYEWDDRTNVNYTRWDEGQPDNLPDENCGEFFYRKGKSYGMWNDNKCDHKKAFICKMPQINNNPSSNPLLCEVTGYSFQKSCYTPVQSIMSWEDAENYCVENHHGHLISIRDFVTQRFFEYMFDKPGAPTSQWLGIKIPARHTLKWSSDFFVSYTNWEDSGFKANHEKETGLCAAKLVTGHWTTRKCSEKLPFICESTTDTPPPTLPPLENYECPKGDWIDFGGDRCYFFELDREMSWFEANYECMRKDAHLASIHSNEERNMIAYFLKILWRGVYIGLYRGPDEEFRWVDGTVKNFTAWSINEPNSVGEKCTEINQPRSWNDLNCGDPRYYMCSVFKVYEVSSANKTVIVNDTQESPPVTTPDSASERKGEDEIFWIAGMCLCVLVIFILVIALICLCRPWANNDNRNRKLSQETSQTTIYKYYERQMFPTKNSKIYENDTEIYENV